jgi:hypothetical protein
VEETVDAVGVAFEFSGNQIPVVSSLFSTPRPAPRAGLRRVRHIVERQDAAPIEDGHDNLSLGVVWVLRIKDNTRGHNQTGIGSGDLLTDKHHVTDSRHPWRCRL